MELVWKFTTQATLITKLAFWKGWVGTVSTHHSIDQRNDDQKKVLFRNSERALVKIPTLPTMCSSTATLPSLRPTAKGLGCGCWVCDCTIQRKKWMLKIYVFGAMMSRPIVMKRFLFKLAVTFPKFPYDLSQRGMPILTKMSLKSVNINFDRTAKNKNRPPNVFSRSWPYLDY